MGNSLYDFAASEPTSSTSGGVNTAEGQNPSTVNDAFRALKQLMAKWLDDAAGVNTVTGTATAILVTTAQGFTAYGAGAGQIANGTLLVIKMAAAATGAATIAVDGLAAKKVRRQGDAAIQADDWALNGYLLLRYDTAYDGASGAWVLLNREVTGVVTLTGTETLTNKTLTSPVLTTPQINDTTGDHQYIFVPSELAADRNVTLPLLTTNDTLVFAAFAQALTNKTINGSNNTISNIGMGSIDPNATTRVAYAYTASTINLNSSDSLDVDVQTVNISIAEERTVSIDASFVVHLTSIPSGEYLLIELVRGSTVIDSSVQKIDQNFETGHGFNVPFVDPTSGTGTIAYSLRLSTADDSSGTKDQLGGAQRVNVVERFLKCTWLR